MYPWGSTALECQSYTECRGDTDIYCGTGKFSNKIFQHDFPLEGVLFLGGPLGVGFFVLFFLPALLRHKPPIRP